MKKLLSTILFLLPTLALAIDKPIPCTGNSCKLLFETTGAGGAKVSAGSVDGLGKWTIGPAASTSDHAINGSVRATRKITVGGASGIGTYVGIYQVSINPASTVTCTTECQNSDSTNGLGASSGLCLAAWNGSAADVTCAYSVNEVKHCLCVGLD